MEENINITILKKNSPTGNTGIGLDVNIDVRDIGWRWEVDVTYSESCPMMGFGINGVESLGSTTRVFKFLKAFWHPLILSQGWEKL